MNKDYHKMMTQALEAKARWAADEETARKAYEAAARAHAKAAELYSTADQRGTCRRIADKASGIALRATKSASECEHCLEQANRRDRQCWELRGEAQELANGFYYWFRDARKAKLAATDAEREIKLLLVEND